MRKLSSINEGIWTSGIRRSSDEETVRSEDINRFFGKDVDCMVWEEYRTGWNSVKRNFQWKEIGEILDRNPGWRLPSLEDIMKISMEVCEYEAGDMDTNYEDIDSGKYILMKVEQDTGGERVTLHSRYGDLELVLSGQKNYLGHPCGKGEWTGFWISDESLTKDGETRRWTLLAGNNSEEFGDLDWYNDRTAFNTTASETCGFQVVLIRDKVQEGIWTSGIRRSSDENVRDEDRDNVPEMEWVDFGDRFKYLVADRFYRKLNQDTFGWEEADELFPEGGRIRMFTAMEFDDWMLFCDSRREGGEIIVSRRNHPGASVKLPVTDGEGAAETWTSGDNKWKATEIIGFVRDSDSGASTFARPDTDYHILLIKEKQS